jgi:bis(5'-adenosyl)-triphosphatase
MVWYRRFDLYPRFSGLSSAEVSDLFTTVRCVSGMIEEVYKVASLNIAIQDGLNAGQSVQHLHVPTQRRPRRPRRNDGRGGGQYWEAPE